MDDGTYRGFGGRHREMRKRKKFHEVRYPKSRVLRGRNSAKQTKETVLPSPAASDSTSSEINVSEETPEVRAKREAGVLRIIRMHGGNVPDPEEEIEVKNGRQHYDGSWTGCKIEDSIIILTDIETGFFRECVEADGGGWYGQSNQLKLEKYGLRRHDRIRKEHIPQVEERERDNLLLRLIYRKAYHRATANIPAFGKSAEILVQECWFKCYLPWRCLDRDIPRSVEVAKNILQDLAPEITEQAKIVQTKIKAELRLRKVSGEYNNDVVLGPAGVPGWTALPEPKTRDELNRLEAFYEENRVAKRRVKEKQDAHFKKKIGPVGSYGADDVWDKETSLEDLQKRIAAR